MSLPNRLNKGYRNIGYPRDAYWAKVRAEKAKEPQRKELPITYRLWIFIGGRER